MQRVNKYGKYKFHYQTPPCMCVMSDVPNKLALLSHFLNVVLSVSEALPVANNK